MDVEFVKAHKSRELLDLPAMMNAVLGLSYDELWYEIWLSLSDGFKFISSEKAEEIRKCWNLPIHLYLAGNERKYQYEKYHVKNLDDLSSVNYASACTIGKRGVVYGQCCEKHAGKKLSPAGYLVTRSDVNESDSLEIKLSNFVIEKPFDAHHEILTAKRMARFLITGKKDEKSWVAGVYVVETPIKVVDELPF